MKMLSLLLSFACLQLAAKGYSQEITLSIKDVPLEKAFKEIEKQTPFHFFYSSEAIKLSHRVTIEVKNESLENVLKLCFNNQPISYSIEDKLIIVKVADEKKNTDNSFHDVRGRVINDQGEPIVGASILLKETNKGTATDQNGEFVLTDVPPNCTLIISSVGYQRQEIELAGRSTIAVQLSIFVSSLDETVVIAYGTTTKRLNTGSVSKVTGEEISKQPVSNPLAALEGRVPGLFITQGTGLPGSNFSVIIRGKNSIQNGNSPLYIIDGVPFLSDADRLTQFNSVNANSPFNTINPEDIESVEILKDADATAIYGSRAANGVILITTKKGKAGKTKFDLNTYTGWGRITHALDFMNSQQYVQMRRQAFLNDAVTPTQSNAYDLLVWDTSRYTNWKNLLIGNTARSNKIQARVSGGNENTNFSLSANYYKETTVFPSDDIFDRRVSVGLNINHKSTNNRFSTSVSASYSNDDSKLITQDLTNSIKQLPPNAPAVYDSLGKLKFRDGGFPFSNPYALLLQTYEGNTTRLTANANLGYKIINGLHFKTSFGYTTVGINETSLTPIASQDPSASPTGSSLFGKNDFKSWIIEPQLEYSTNLGKKGKLQTLVGGTWQNNSGESSMIIAFGFTNDALLRNIGSLPQSNVLTTNGYSQYRYEGIYGRINYNWADKYIVNLTGRRDGSSRFGPGKQFANFGAAGMGWLFSQEKFVKKHLRFLSFGKLRGSYGITGNDKIGDYQYLDTWVAASAYQNLTSLKPGKLFNDDYAWEAIRKIETALDFGFINNRILLTVNWFRNRSDNQLIKYNLPAQTGFTNIFRNFPGVVENKGFEFELNSVNFIQKQFQWNSSFNLTISRNKLIAFPGLESSSYATTYMIGQPLTVFLGYSFLGVDPQTGIYKFDDINKDGTISPRSATSMNDYMVVGTTDPKFYGGLENNIHYKEWQLDFLFQFVKQLGRHPVYSNTTPPGNRANQPTLVLDHWQSAGVNAPYQKFTQGTGTTYTQQQLVAKSSAALTDASYIRLKIISVSYSLPSTITERFKIESFRFFMQAQNVFTINKYKGLDPENQSFSFLPPLRMITTGFQIIF